VESCNCQPTSVARGKRCKDPLGKFILRHSEFSVLQFRVEMRSDALSYPGLGSSCRFNRPMTGIVPKATSFKNHGRCLRLQRRWSRAHPGHGHRMYLCRREVPSPTDCLAYFHTSEHLDHPPNSWMALCVFEDWLHRYTDQLVLDAARV
jgi:hypothetical protein